jgi:hypothetical protein
MSGIYQAFAHPTPIEEAVQVGDEVRVWLVPGPQVQTRVVEGTLRQVKCNEDGEVTHITVINRNLGYIGLSADEFGSIELIA